MADDEKQAENDIFHSKFIITKRAQVKHPGFVSHIVTSSYITCA